MVFAKQYIRLALCLALVVNAMAYTFAQSPTRTGEGSATADNSTVIVSAGTTELRFSEKSFFGPNSHWVINGTLEIWSKEIWIAPTARFTGTGKIIIHNPGDNPYYELMNDSPTFIDGNNADFIGVTMELRNPNNLILSDIADPGYGTTNPSLPAKTAALNLGAKFIFSVDYGDVILNSNDFSLSSEAQLMASVGGALGSRRMIVTGNSVAGHVIKQYGNTLAVLFPVGIAEEDYTPATIAPQSPTSVYVSVQDYGAASPLISNEERGMDRVWHITADQGVQATYTLQHNRITNGVAYVDNLTAIVQYAGSGNWIGDATTLQGEGIHTRADILLATGISADQSWFTKLADNAKAPTAVNDEVVGNSCEPIHIQVLVNDVPGSSAILVSSVTIVQQPRNGRVTVNLDGSMIYYADRNFVGEDSFIYEIKDEEGQTAQATVRVLVNECGIRVPNAFSPNGDGINDYFVIPGSERYERMELSIFNRWGNEVYRSDNYNNDWAGLNLHEGIYYYRLIVYENGRRSNQDGWVLMIRN